MCRAARALGILLLVVGPMAGPASGTDRPRHGTVVRVVDGDTLVVRLDGDDVRVRLIGIDTPELHDSPKLERQLRRGWDRNTIRKLGQRAYLFAEARLDGRRARLELDAQTHDDYGRLLAYVWVDEVLINAELLRHGHARTLSIPPNVRHARRFADLERAARADGRGLWAEWPPRAANESALSAGP